MGMPYSKQVNEALDQVTPLVAAGLEVLQTTKSFAILLAVAQVFVAIVLTLTLLAILALIYSINPDLETERKALVTPCMQWLARWISEYGALVGWVGVEGACCSLHWWFGTFCLVQFEPSFSCCSLTST
jgi:hypothetical protein